MRIASRCVQMISRANERKPLARAASSRIASRPAALGWCLAPLGDGPGVVLDRTREPPRRDAYARVDERAEHDRPYEPEPRDEHVGGHQCAQGCAEHVERVEPRQAPPHVGAAGGERLGVGGSGDAHEERGHDESGDSEHEAHQVARPRRPFDRRCHVQVERHKAGEHGREGDAVGADRPFGDGVEAQRMSEAVRQAAPEGGARGHAQHERDQERARRVGGGAHDQLDVAAQDHLISHRAEAARDEEDDEDARDRPQASAGLVHAECPSSTAGQSIGGEWVRQRRLPRCFCCGRMRNTRGPQANTWPSSQSSPRATPPHAFRGSLSRKSRARR